MSAVQDAFVLDAVADDQSIPNKAASREAVRAAINEAAKHLGWRVTAADLRRYYPPSINDKHAPVYRVTGPIPKEAVEP